MTCSLILVHIIGLCQGATFSSIASGDFDNPVGNPGSPWSIISGTDPDGIPDRYDQIIINGGHTITASNTGFSQISNFSNDGTLILNSSFEFRVWGSNNAFLSAVTSTNNGTISGSGVLYFITNNAFSNSGTLSSFQIKSLFSYLGVGETLKEATSRENYCLPQRFYVYLNKEVVLESLQKGDRRAEF